MKKKTEVSHTLKPRTSPAALIRKMKSERHGEISKTHQLLAEEDIVFAERYDDLFEVLMTKDRLLNVKTKELIVVGMLAALGQYGALKTHIRRALKSGLTKGQLIEVLELAMMYSGTESMIHGGQTLLEVLEE